jgi:hypothetical protein
MAVACLAVGYTLGVWTACAVLRPTQRAHEEAGATEGASALTAQALAPDPVSR